MDNTTHNKVADSTNKVTAVTKEGRKMAQSAKWLQHSVGTWIHPHLTETGAVGHAYNLGAGEIKTGRSQRLGDQPV